MGKLDTLYAQMLHNKLCKQMTQTQYAEAQREIDRLVGKPREEAQARVNELQRLQYSAQVEMGNAERVEKDLEAAIKQAHADYIAAKAALARQEAWLTPDGVLTLQIKAARAEYEAAYAKNGAPLWLRLLDAELDRLTREQAECEASIVSLRRALDDFIAPEPEPVLARKHR